jgi:ABC-type multidrug transport system fused ATPase/permease subunit
LTDVTVLGWALAAVIGWFSLVTVEFYERIYRNRIEDNQQRLKALSDDQLATLTKEIESETRHGKEVDSNRLRERLRHIRSLRNAQDNLVRERGRILALLAVATLITLFTATWAVFFPLWDLTYATAFTYVLLGLVFFSGFHFLAQMFSYDREIIAIMRTEKESTPLSKPEFKPKGKVDYSHLSAVYFSAEGDPMNPVGDRIIVNSRTKMAYYMGGFVDSFIFDNSIPSKRYPESSLKDWCAQHGLHLITRPPFQEELE